MSAKMSYYAEHLAYIAKVTEALNQLPTNDDIHIGVSLYVTEEIEVPGPTETVTPEPKVITETVTEEVEVEVAPASCGDALTAAEDVFQINGEALELAADMIGYAGYGDTASLEQATDDLNALQDPLSDALDDYYASAFQCR